MKKAFGLIGGILQTIGLLVAGVVFGLIMTIFADIGGEFFKASAIVAIFVVACLIGIVSSIIQAALWKKWSIRFKRKIVANVISLLMTLFIAVYLIILLFGETENTLISILLLISVLIVGAIMTILDLIFGIIEYKRNKGTSSSVLI